MMHDIFKNWNSYYYERKRVQTGTTQSEDFSFPVLGLVRTCSLLPYTRLSCRGVTPVKNRILASRGLLTVYEVLMMTAVIGIIPMSK